MSETLDELLGQFKHDPRVFNLLASTEIRMAMVKYFTENAQKIEFTGGYSQYIDTVLQNNPSAILRDLHEYKIQSPSGTDVSYDHQEFLNGNITLSSNSYMYKCCNCGEILKYHLYSDRIVVEHKPDTCFEHKDFELKLEVPSDGRVAISDTLGTVLTEPDEWISCNTPKGQYLVSKDAESKGFVSFCVGNSSPGVYQLQDGTVIVASSSYVCTEESDYEEFDTNKFPGIKCIADVCTDLWTCTIAPESHCKRLHQEGVGKYNTGADIINLEPGEWKCTVHPVQYNYGSVLFATLTKVQKDT